MIQVDAWESEINDAIRGDDDPFTRDKNDGKVSSFDLYNECSVRGRRTLFNSSYLYNEC